MSIISKVIISGITRLLFSLAISKPWIYSNHQTYYQRHKLTKIIAIQDKKQAMINFIIDNSDDTQLITNLSEIELKSLLDLN